MYFKDSEGEQAVGVDGTFTLLGAGFGAVSAFVVFLWRRRGGVPLVVGLAVGGLLGSLLAWRVGVWLGPASDVLAAREGRGQGGDVRGAAEVEGQGGVVGVAGGGAVVHLGVTALFGPRGPQPDGWRFRGYGAPVQ